MTKEITEKHNSVAKNLTVDVSQFWEKDLSLSDHLHLSTSPKIPDLKLLSLLNFDLGLYSLEDGVETLIEDLKVDIEQLCVRCLQKYSFKIKISKFTSQFLFEPKDKEEAPDPFEYFLIDKKTRKIDLKDLIRQQIILHFPVKSVCSESCKGYCGNCGVNKNEKNCNCQEAEVKNTPLSQLKDLIKVNHAKTRSTKAEKT